jgi:short-subunit dehydrogenase
MLRSPAMQIAGSTILVTGASSGIGAALAPLLARRGATVGIVARRRERLERVLAECHEHAPESRLWAVDLGDLDAAVAVAQDAWDVFGGLDCVVHNAAIPKRVPVGRLTAKMLERGHGLTAFVSSVGGRIGIAHEAAYCASKFALAGFSEAMAIDLHGTGVGVKLLLPGSIETEIWDQPGNDPAQFAGPFISPEECALSMVAALEADGFEYFVPPNLPESDRTYEQVVQGKTSNVDGWIGAMGQMAQAHDSGAD